MRIAGVVALVSSSESPPERTTNVATATTSAASTMISLFLPLTARILGVADLGEPKPSHRACCSVVAPWSIEGASTVSSLKTKTKIATIARPRTMPRVMPMSRSDRRKREEDRQ